MASRRLFATGGNPVKVELYYDVISPYAWFAFETLCRYRKPWNLDLQLKPVYLGAILGTTKNTGPLTVPNKARYMFEDLPRCAKYFHVPLNPIQNPFERLPNKDNLKPLRFLLAVNSSNPSAVESLSRQLWLLVWNEDKDFTTNENLKVAAERAGISPEDAAKYLKAMDDPHIKNSLKDNTTLAIDKGAYGTPFIVLHKGNEEETFFGSDRFHLIADSLGFKWNGPLPTETSSSL